MAGASPNHSVDLRLAPPALAMWFIHMDMQLGCLALDESIQVSDQPVEPSLGSTVSIGTLSAFSRLAMTCQVVPTTESPCVNAAVCLV